MRRALFVVILGVLVFRCPSVVADDPIDESDAKRVEILVLQSLRVQLEQSQSLAYTEIARFGAKRKRFDWTLASFPEGDWSVRATLPKSDGGTTCNLYIRRGAERLVGKVEPNLDWAAVIEDYVPKGAYLHSPTASRWFPVDAMRVDERIRQWDPIDTEVNADNVAISVPANTSVVDALADPGATMHGLFGYRFEFRTVGDLYVLSRCDILQVARTRGGEDSEGVECLDEWRRTIAGYQVCRSHSRVWSDFRLVGAHVLPMRWEYRFPEGTTEGEVLADTIEQLPPEELARRLVLHVPEAWTGEGVLRDRRTGEVILARGGSKGLGDAEAPPGPREYARGRKSQSTGFSTEFVILVVAGGLLALLSFLIAARNRRRRKA